MNAKIHTCETVQLLGVRRFELGEVWAEVTLNHASSINPRNFIVTASHGIPERIKAALTRKDALACFGSGTVWNIDKRTAVSLASMIVRESVKSFGVRAY